MYLCHNGFTNTFVQYECRDVRAVAKKIGELTNTKTCTEDWKEYCYTIKKTGGSDSVDYICLVHKDWLANGKYKLKEEDSLDCSVFIGYDNYSRTYIVWVELDI